MTIAESPQDIDLGRYRAAIGRGGDEAAAAIAVAAAAIAVAGAGARIRRPRGRHERRNAVQVLVKDHVAIAAIRIARPTGKPGTVIRQGSERDRATDRE